MVNGIELKSAVAICVALSMCAVAAEEAPLPPEVQARIAAEIGSAKLVTEDLAGLERPWTFTAYVPNDRIVWSVSDRPEAVFELRDAEGRLVTGEALADVKLRVESYRTYETSAEEVSFAAEGNPVRRVLTLDHPGVVAVTASVLGKPIPASGKKPNRRFLPLVQVLVDAKGKRMKNKLSSRVGALFDPLKIVAAKPIPEGFDETWRRFVEEDSKYSNMPKYFHRRGTNDNENVWTFAGVLDSPAGEVHFDWGVPAAAREGKKLPIRVFLQAYSCGYHFAETWIGNSLTLGINCHSVSNRAPSAYWKAEMAKRPNFGFSTNENAKVETCYHIGMLRRDIRAIRWAMSQPEWDGTNIVFHGDSQGGFQTFALAGIFPDVRSAWSVCPWYVDIGGSQHHWRPVWQLGPDFADPVHHITRTKAKRIKYTFGICDSAGPADGLMAMFNLIPDTTDFAEITIIQGRGHDAGNDSAKVCPSYVFTKRNGKVAGEYRPVGTIAQKKGK